MVRGENFVGDDKIFDNNDENFVGGGEIFTANAKAFGKSDERFVVPDEIFAGNGEIFVTVDRPTQELPQAVLRASIA